MAGNVIKYTNTSHLYCSILRFHHLFLLMFVQFLKAVMDWKLFLNLFFLMFLMSLNLNDCLFVHKECFLMDFLKLASLFF